MQYTYKQRRVRIVPGSAKTRKREAYYTVEREDDGRRLTVPARRLVVHSNPGESWKEECGDVEL